MAGPVDWACLYDLCLGRTDLCYGSLLSGRSGFLCTGSVGTLLRLTLTLMIDRGLYNILRPVMDEHSGWLVD